MSLSSYQYHFLFSTLSYSFSFTPQDFTNRTLVATCNYLSNAMCIDNNQCNVYCYADNDVLYSKIYESEEESDAHSALWRYRTRLSLKHLLGSAQTKSYKVLNKFLEQVVL